MMFVLDTNVVSELRKVRHGKSDPNVAAWAERMNASDLFVSAITIMELEMGVLSIERRDAAQGTLLRSWLEQHVLPEFSERTLPVDTLLLSVAPGSTFQTSAASGMHSLLQRHWFTR